MNENEKQAPAGNITAFDNNTNYKTPALSQASAHHPRPEHPLPPAQRTEPTANLTGRLISADTIAISNEFHGS